MIWQFVYCFAAAFSGAFLFSLVREFVARGYLSTKSFGRMSAAETVLSLTIVGAVFATCLSAALGWAA